MKERKRRKAILVFRIIREEKSVLRALFPKESSKSGNERASDKREREKKDQRASERYVVFLF